MYQKHEVVGGYIKLLDNEDNKAKEISLECLFTVLGLGEKAKKDRKLIENLFVVQLLNGDGIEKIEDLQHNKS